MGSAEVFFRKPRAEKEKHRNQKETAQMQQEVYFLQNYQKSFYFFMRMLSAMRIISFSLRFAITLNCIFSCSSIQVIVSKA